MGKPRAESRMPNHPKSAQVRKYCTKPEAEQVIRQLASKKLNLGLLKQIADQVFQIKYEHLRKVLNGDEPASAGFEIQLKTKLEPTAEELRQIFGNRDHEFEGLRREILDVCGEFPEFVLRNHLAEFTGTRPHYMPQRLAMRLGEAAARGNVGPINLADLTMQASLSRGEATSVDDLVPIPPEHLLRSAGQEGAVRWLIQGHAGSGKTTLTRRLAAVARHTKCVPLWASLAAWAQLREELVDHWARWLFAKLCGRKPTERAPDVTRLALLAEAIQYWLKCGQAVVLLDGLDEVPADDQETALQRIRTVALCGPRCPILVTSRYGGYADALASRLGGAVRLMDLMPIEWNEVVPFLNHHLPAERAHKLASDLRRHPQMRGISGNPFFLNLAAFVFARNCFELPDSLVKVYSFAINELLCVPLERTSPYPRGTDRPDSAVLRKVIRRVAWEAFLAHGTDAIATGPLLDWILRGLRIHWTPQAQRPLAVRVMGEFNQRRLLSEAGEGYQFMHLSVQEFLAAEHLNDPASGLDVLGIVDRAAWLRRWQLLLPFVAGTAGAPEKLAALLDRLLAREEGEVGKLDDFHGRRTWLAARCLALARRDGEEWQRVWRAYVEQVDTRLWATWTGSGGKVERMEGLLEEHPLLAEALPHRFGGGPALKTTTALLNGRFKLSQTSELARTGDSWVVDQLLLKFDGTAAEAERVEVLRALRGTTFPKAINKLLDILTDKYSPMLRVHAAEALEGTTDYQTTARLVAMLEPKGPIWARTEAADALRGTTDPNGLRALLDCLIRGGEDTSAAGRELVASAARSLRGTTNGEIITELTARMRDGQNVRVQRASAQALHGSVDPDAVAGFIRLLDQCRHDGVRHAVAEALVNASSHAAVTALTACLRNDQSAMVRSAALASLHHATEPDAITLLTGLLEKDPSTAVRMGAAQALQGTSVPKAVESLVHELRKPVKSRQDADDLYLTRVAQALRGNRNRAVLTTLLEVAKGRLPDDKPHPPLVRAAAVMSLQSIDHEWVTDTLAEQLLLEKDAVVKGALARALYGCGSDPAIRSLAKCFTGSTGELRVMAGRSLRAAMQDEQTYLRILDLIPRDAFAEGMVPLWPSKYVIWPDLTTSPIERLAGDLR